MHAPSRESCQKNSGPGGPPRAKQSMIAEKAQAKGEDAPATDASGVAGAQEEMVGRCETEAPAVTGTPFCGAGLKQG